MTYIAHFGRMAWVFASGNRVREGKYFDNGNYKQWDVPAMFLSESSVEVCEKKTSVRCELVAGLTDVLDAFRTETHHGGAIDVGKLYLRIGERGDNFWRCMSCERVHMHYGVGICTKML